LCQTIPALSTILALFDLSDVLTIPTFPRLEQLFTKMRIAGAKSLTWVEVGNYDKICNLWEIFGEVVDDVCQSSMRQRFFITPVFL
jgi:hypothetical protein